MTMHPKLTISERDWQAQVIELARFCGWRVAHFRPAQNANGDWRTPVAADGKGFPDLVLVHRNGGVVFAELKSEKGRLSAAQSRWIAALDVAPGVEVRVWRPSDWDDVTDVLMGARRPTPLSDRIEQIADAAEAAEIERAALTDGGR